MYALYIYAYLSDDTGVIIRDNQKYFSAEESVQFPTILVENLHSSKTNIKNWQQSKLNYFYFSYKMLRINIIGLYRLVWEVCSNVRVVCGSAMRWRVSIHCERVSMACFASSNRQNAKCLLGFKRLCRKKF